ncbi:MAG: hypothetical protein V1676_07205 [Candidatus Diapherotrites archaeon]
MKHSKLAKGIFALLAALLFVPSASAGIDVAINVADSFSSGEKISFDYSISSDYGTGIVFVPHVECPNAPNAPLNEETAALIAGKAYSGTYSGIEVDGSLEPQECTASVDVKSPEQARGEKKFRIETNPSFRFEIFSCADQGCNGKSGFFTPSETIYFGFESETAEPAVSAELVLPDGTTKTIGLPGSIAADELGPGSYELRATAKKEGYKTMRKTAQFAVIEKHAEIPSVSRCNGNHVCDVGENAQNCPQDCPFAGAAAQPALGEPVAEPAGIDWLLVFGGAAVLLALMLIAYFKFYKPRQMEA